MAKTTTVTVQTWADKAVAFLKIALAPAVASLNLACKTAGVEAEQSIKAFVIGATKGEDGADEALNQGGDPMPENIGFHLGLAFKQTLDFAITTGLQAVIGQMLGAKPKK